jgi:hypothetical protein
MIVNSARLSVGLTASMASSLAASSASATLGSNASLALTTDGNNTSFRSAASFGALLVNDSGVTFADNKFTSGSSWAAGSPAIYTATVTGGPAADSRTITITITSDIIGGTGGVSDPIEVSVYAGDTAAVVAAAIREALLAYTTVSDYYAVSGTGANIILTQKPRRTHVIGGVSYPIYYGVDSTFLWSFAFAEGSGFNEPTQVVTSAGAATLGAKLFDCDGKDLEGIALPVYDPTESFMLIEAYAGNPGFDTDIYSASITCGSVITGLMLKPFSSTLKNVLLTGSESITNGLDISGEDLSGASVFVSLTYVTSI